MKKYLLGIAYTAIFLLSGLVISYQPTKAQDYPETPCDSAHYSAFAQLPEGNLKAYVKSGRSEDNGRAKLYYRDLEIDECRLLGESDLTTNKYNPSGTLSLEKTTNFGAVFLSIDKSSVTDAGASTPQVIFTELDNPPCDISSKCLVKYNNQDFILSPKKVSLENDTLRVGLLGDINKEIVEVIYSVDGKPAYKKPLLEEFNLNYVPDGEHTITRTVVLKDGQSLSESRVITRGLEGGVTYLFISILYGQSKLLRYLVVLTVVLVIYSLVIYILKKIISKRRWKRQHFFDPSEHFDISKAGARQHISTDDSYGQIIRRYKAYLIMGLSLVTVVFIANAYAITTFKVDGVSMFPTLEDGSRKILLTLPINIGKLNNNYYLPNRGFIVVVKQDKNNLFDATNETEQSYVVKRVVALPNERVVIKDGIIKVFNKENPMGYEPDTEYGWVKDLSGSENLSMDIKLKAGEIFVIGDNRDESIDSRFYGPISTDKVIGKVL